MTPEKLPARLMFRDEMGYSKDTPILAYGWCPAGLQFLTPRGYHTMDHTQWHDDPRFGNFREPTSDELAQHETEWQSMFKVIKKWEDDEAAYEKIMKEISFTKVSLPFGWLGNMAPYSIVAPIGLLKGLDGITFRTSEALFMAMRFADQDIQKAIWAERSPMGAKMLAKKHASQMVVQPRSDQDVANMRIVLKLKLDQHKLDEDLLITGDAEIIEDCTARQNESGLFWGAAKVNGVWVGKNMLGKMWMELRQSIQ